MDFIFAKDTESDALLQGDLLIRNAGLKDVLAPAHPYYAEAPDYTHFVVLTQSCDLVRRTSRPKARYITLAAARPVTLVVDRFTSQHRLDFDFPLVLCQKAQELRARQILERLIHNTEDGFFFLKKDCHPALDQDLCVFLPLSIAIRAEHYDSCLKAKIAQMDHIFAAKLGWLAGNIYSRVGTPDIEEKIPDAEKYKENFYEEVLFGRTAWLSSAQFKALKSLVRAWRVEHPGENLDADTAKEMLESQLPTDFELVVDRVASLLSGADLIGGAATSNAVRNVLLSDKYLEKLIKATA
jgi:hypothetical protein